MKKKNKTSLIKLCFIAMLSAIAIVLMLLEFPVVPIPAAAHLKMDLSDIAAIFGAIIYGPFTGVAIELIKNLIELSLKGLGTQMGFGNLMNFIVGCAFVVPFSAIYRKSKKRGNENRGIIVGSIAGFLSIVLIGLAANYVITPLFFKFFLSVELDSATLNAAVLTATIINAAKGILLSAVSVPIIKLILARIKFIK